ncbi:hypothetical protein KIN20_009210 [Parelaphostrongylus tenuis]|uniref:Uncharacterized protein n=1 Tax=Parelaphostrongylus tenuis TaxID=148309 RepID=A0AAD5QI50_PARTN|nr:hypothetical protein KIN20_009210 [Parelaphostrongylus tenuis]
MLISVHIRIAFKGYRSNDGSDTRGGIPEHAVCQSRSDSPLLPEKTALGTNRNSGSLPNMHVLFYMD